MKQAEKALREAGWEDVARSDVEPGEEFYDIHAGMSYEARRITEGVPVQDYPVLRAPRSEPKYDLDTVARLERLTDGDQFNAVIDHNGEWHSAYSTYSSQEVEVLRIIAYPDGTSPWINLLGSQVNRIKVIDESGYGYINDSARDVEYAFEDDDQTFKIFTGGTSKDSSDYPDVDSVIEGMAPVIAQWGIESAICSGRVPEWCNLTQGVKRKWVESARNVLREAYEEATK